MDGSASFKQRVAALLFDVFSTGICLVYVCVVSASLVFLMASLAEYRGPGALVWSLVCHALPLVAPPLLLLVPLRVLPWIAIRVYSCAALPELSRRARRSSQELSDHIARVREFATRRWLYHCTVAAVLYCVGFAYNKVLAWVAFGIGFWLNFILAFTVELISNARTTSGAESRFSDEQIAILSHELAANPAPHVAHGESCSLCLEPLEGERPCCAAHPCGHVYHAPCLREAVQFVLKHQRHVPRCALCRQVLENPVRGAAAVRQVAAIPLAPYDVAASVV